MSNKIQYRRVGDYLIPNLIIPPEEANVRLGKWGMMHKSYLEKNKKVVFNTLLMQGKLYQHCAEIETQGRDMFDTLVEQMKQVETVVLLSQRRPDTHIDIKLDLSELDITAAETKATYQELRIMCLKSLA